MKKLFFLLFFFFLCISIADAQELMKQRDRIFNYGIKAGLNSLLLDVESIELSGYDLDNVQPINNVGYSFELLGIINIKRFFIQPSIVWKYSQGDIQFDLLQPPLVGAYDPRITAGLLNVEIKSLEVPVMLGYNLIKEKPYVLSVMSGTKFKYNYDISYSNMWNMENDDNYYLSLYSAVEVIIGRLTFDFGYEHGLNKMRSTFDYMPNSSDCKPMRLKNRLDGLNMSIGILF